MQIKAVKFYEKGFMTQPFAMGGEDGVEKFDAKVRYRSCLQNYLIDTGDEVILVDTGLPKEFPAQVMDENAQIYLGNPITDYVSARLVKSNEKPETNVTGTSDLNPVEGQAALIKQLVPSVKTVGVIYNSSEVNSEVQVGLLKNAAKKEGFELKIATVSTVNDIQQAANSLVGKVQALYLPTDNVIASAIPTLIKVTNAAKLPVICGEANMVRGGGLATVGIDYYELGRITGDMGADILEGKAKPQTTAIRHQTKFKTVLNDASAKLLGIEFPKALRDNAEIVGAASK